MNKRMHYFFIYVHCWLATYHLAFSAVLINHQSIAIVQHSTVEIHSLSGVPDYFGRNKISSGGDLSHYSSASLY